MLRLERPLLVCRLIGDQRRIVITNELRGLRKSLAVPDYGRAKKFLAWTPIAIGACVLM